MKKSIYILLIILVYSFSCSDGDKLPLPTNPMSGKKGKIEISVTPNPYPAGKVNLLVNWSLTETGCVDVSIDSIISNVYNPDGTYNLNYSEKFITSLEISQLFGTYQIYAEDSVSTVFNLDYVPIEGGRNEIIVYARDRFRNIFSSSVVIPFE